jgi:peptidoglycan/xylan/chitin deacetylase (PgdA/CDA1 family)
MGAVALLTGCADEKRPEWRAAPAANLPGDSHPGSASPSADGSPSPSGSPSKPPTWPTVAKPTPNVCPTVPGIVQTPGGPQHYLPCRGTDIALTIDDGPDPAYTPQILALLARYDIKATFCMIGKHAAAYPNLVAAVAAGGHHIANHTFTHPLNLPKLTTAQIRTEVERGVDAITAGGAAHPKLFRATGGNWSSAVVAACTAAGMRPLDWSVDPRDWSEPGVSHIVTTILTKTHPGSIILDHDGGGNRQQTVDALTIALPRLLDDGYTFTQP